MVACRDDDVHGWALKMELHEIVVEGFLHRGGWLLDVEHVAADEQRIGLFLSAPFRELLEEVAVFVRTVVVLVDDLSEMQIRSM